MSRPNDDPRSDPRVAELISAAQHLLRNMGDTDSLGPDDDSEGNDYPQDENGDYWYHDTWDLHQALKALES